jgi:hypothetical protein
MCPAPDALVLQHRYYWPTATDSKKAIILALSLADTRPPYGFRCLAVSSPDCAIMKPTVAISE